MGFDRGEGGGLTADQAGLADREVNLGAQAFQGVERDEAPPALDARTDAPAKVRGTPGLLKAPATVGQGRCIGLFNTDFKVVGRVPGKGISQTITKGWDVTHFHLSRFLWYAKVYKRTERQSTERAS